MTIARKLIGLCLGAATLPGIAAAQEGAPAVNSGDTAWVLTATALVLFMSLPGLALFYGGLVRAKNYLSVLMKIYAIAALASIVWVFAGYSIAFGTGNGWWGGLDNLLLKNLGRDAVSGTIPESVFLAFQMTFAIITPGLIVGAFVERVKFLPVMIFTALWLLIVYAPVTHWIWGGGWLAEMGVIDFAGVLVVHATAGISALAYVFMLGKRRGFPHEIAPPHRPAVVMIGASMLWIGWFGFNGGSVLSADPELTSLTLVTTCLAAAAGGVVAALVSFIRYKNLDLTMFLNGILGGLVGITAGADVMTPESAIIIGAVAGSLIVFAVSCVDAIRLDDPVGAIAVHLICGIWGTLAVGIFSTNEEHTFLTQLLGVVCYAAFCLVTSFVIIFTLKKLVGIRVSEKEELEGLDAHEHGMDAYPDFRLNEH